VGVAAVLEHRSAGDKLKNERPIDEGVNLLLKDAK